MLIKLRQGAGRLIRTESDTGVLSILDVRAVRSAYAGSVNQALKQFPLVSSVEEIEQFIRSVKPASYFADNHPNNEADLNSCSRKGD
jgi:ATP-dependent DNA helicase DinG